ncbi:MAG: S24/S26 family peptidase [Clostridia bacterium]|nr:S24/S26 family peptidase [Clostridia bacterium]
MQNKQYTMEELYPLLLEVIESGGEFRLWPRGTSMLPLLREGKDSVLLVMPLHCQKHDICLYRRADGAFVLHRLMKFEKNGDPIFCGDNQTALEYGVSREQIIARACAVYRGDRRISVSSRKYRFYVFLHSMMPLRRLRFLPRRIWGRLKRMCKN